ncbi:MAG: hypothetical protein A2736_02955 [Candidatus Yanofskybacteria bacterium RIFCSPHIGHO2_01_FULL_41_27]|uniref:Serine protease n=3 Tax=Parcubacteria group TaxID=1794811 RepID=A0A1F8HU28_9BACT|nr:MAG: hypothetical protein UU83_C0031G0008 [Candidatus Jorgensenbacteria bacterium GW2011_GWF2_41_8]OGM99216.1 MAG: hypothetical protein A2736_02955 [Candidatus Yanofskybacteria bacterium RIFCSPHIGHO2_01_FULL_41_27]OGN09096.1 MAG: hypothetical protein A3C64_01785 [Candidatus Yanofskybacteria bacterium RIFCSPHIGHO2_02_FULL_41_12]OGN20248.1 MAG: hypothetical protein A3B00_02545 [Candidatus Yanofskybacteria bacterium RIFCSPLOWO2_01_FULL_41_33]OGN40530.1 MAG: hypothetical protein A2606_03275 [Can
MALLNTNFLKSLVAIGIEEKKKFSCLATGFLIGFIAKDSKNPAKKQYWIFLVTNRHVFEKRDFVDLRFNTKSEKPKIFRQGLFFPNNEPRWLAHKNKKIDLALLNVSPQILEENSVDFIFLSQEIFAYQRDFSKIGIEIGDAVYVLGFPLGISGNVQNFACVKWGIISRIDKEIVKETKAFLLDSSIFPGNSGGPVIYRPTITRLNNTPAVGQPYLLGVVSGYLPYEEKLFTHQTNPPSVVSLSRENSGLSFVVPMDFVRQILNRWISENKKLEKAQEKTEEQKLQQEVKTSL